MSGIDPSEIEIDWYTDGSEDQVALGIEADDVKIAITFPVTASRSDLETVLAERDRELDHYFEALARVRDSPGRSQFNRHRR
jgi:hypothetical protein